jgi:hypothetical protein
MAIDLRFAFVCSKQWAELVGNDAVRRFCTECSREVVNLDPMTENERKQIFRDAIRTGSKPCVFATIPVENVNSCGAPRPAAPNEDIDEIQTGGEPELGDDYWNDAEDGDDVEIERDAVD